MDEVSEYLSEKMEIESKFQEFSHEHDMDWVQLSTTIEKT